MNLIEKLGLEKCKQIVDGAPTGATDFVLWTGKIRYLNSEINEIYSESSREWFSANIMVLSLMTRLADLRTAIANHGTPTNEGTDNLSHFDHCSDIANHISPLTKVTER